MFAGEKTIFAMHKRTPTKSGGRKPAVVVATHWQRKANSLRMTSVRIRSGERQPAVAVATHWQRKTNSLRMTSVRIRSGGRKPAVGVVT
jgi:predicted transcriptional regulator